MPNKIKKPLIVDFETRSRIITLVEKGKSAADIASSVGLPARLVQEIISEEMHPRAVQERRSGLKG